jgi:hypothetical protein
MEKRSYPAYEVIRKKLSISPVVGVDETGTSINGCFTFFKTKMFHPTITLRKER